MDASEPLEVPPYQGLALESVVLVNSVEKAEAALIDLLAADTVGFDTESKPTFTKGELSTGPHLIQLATDARAYLFQTAQPYGMAGVKAVLESKLIVKVGFGLEADGARLKSRFDITLNNVVDLARALRADGQRNTIGARAAVAGCFGQRLQKSRRISTSNWSLPQLTRQQMLYAADDAHVALRIYRETLKKNGLQLLAVKSVRGEMCSDKSVANDEKEF